MNQFYRVIQKVYSNGKEIYSWNMDLRYGEKPKDEEKAIFNNFDDLWNAEKVPFFTKQNIKPHFNYSKICFYTRLGNYSFKRNEKFLPLRFVIEYRTEEYNCDIHTLSCKLRAEDFLRMLKDYGITSCPMQI